MSEYANKRTHGTFIAVVFAMQGIGILSGGVVALIISYSYDQKYKLPTYEQNPVASIVPATLTYYWRMKMLETARYTALVAKNAKQAAADMSKVLQVEIEAEEEKVKKLAKSDSHKFGLFSKEFAKRYGLYLVGTTTTWVLCDENQVFFSSNFRIGFFSEFFGDFLLFPMLVFNVIESYKSLLGLVAF